MFDIFLKIEKHRNIMTEAGYEFRNQRKSIIPYEASYINGWQSQDKTMLRYYLDFFESIQLNMNKNSEILWHVSFSNNLNLSHYHYWKGEWYHLFLILSSTNFPNILYSIERSHWNQATYENFVMLYSVLHTKNNPLCTSYQVLSFWFGLFVLSL